ncbi:hypothetical protein [Streptomyces sp. TP-A0356]|uniref:hypothetical protein n=1 Tax=Streptomyces sp. TP-A0356 TaxID=1359208 RepID=UPI000AD41167|nr:hypothetical protein [Streptomyces sp. TP-A0356]
MSEYDERRSAARGRDSHERHEPYEWREPTDRREPEDEHEHHAGNGTVNHRPDDQGRHDAGPDRAIPDAGSEGSGAGGEGLGAGGDDGFGAGRDRLLSALGGLGRGGFDADRAGDDRAGDDRSGDDRSGDDRSGDDRSVAGGSGLGGSGFGGSGLGGSGHGGPGADGSGPESAGPGGAPHESEAAPDGLGSDELALRRMLQEAVRDIEPRDGTLDHLRHAVPARRARKRQAVVGMAAAALFIGTAIPALVHVSNATGSDADPSIAGQASQAQGGTSQGKGPDGGSSGAAGSSGTTKEKDKDGQKGKEDKGKGATSGATGGANPTASAQNAPPCTAAQLGRATPTVGAPDSTGTVYGTFRVANVSTASCTVLGGGSVSALAQGAADPTKISVLNHVSGDPATGLPDTAQEVTSLVLKPGGAYEVKFAWVPSGTCPTTGGGTGGPSPDPSPSDSASASGAATASGGGTSPQLMTEAGVADGSVAVSHSVEPGSATSTTTIPNACAGTVYHTGMLPTSS